MQLRNCQADVRLTDITLELMTGEIVTLKNAHVLTSYKSRVAVYHDDVLYLLPRYGYSRTTWQHLHKFQEDFCEGIRVCAADIRKAEKYNYGMGDCFQVARGIVVGRNLYAR